MLSMSVNLIANYWISMLLLSFFFSTILSSLLHTHTHTHTDRYKATGSKERDRSVGRIVKHNVPPQMKSIRCSRLPIQQFDIKLSIVGTIHKSELSCRVRLSVQLHNLIFTLNIFDLRLSYMFTFYFPFCFRISFVRWRCHLHTHTHAHTQPNF